MDFAPLATALATIATGAFAFAKWLLPWIRERRLSADTVSGMRSINHVYQLMNSMLDHGVERVILFAGHNGGGIPSPTRPFYASAMHWASSRPNESVIENYRNIRVDGPYCQMLLDSRTNECLLLETEKMQPCKLKEFYQAEGVSHSIIYYICEKDKRFYYLSMANYDQPAPTGLQRTRLLMRAEQIADTIKKDKYEAG